VARISIKTQKDLPETMQSLWARMQAYGDFENMAGAMAHRRPIFEHIWKLLIELGEEAVISKRHLYLLMVATSQLNSCAYCVSHDKPKLVAHGLSEEGVARLLDYKDHPELDEVDKLVVEYAIAVTNNWSRTRDDIFRRLKQHFTEAQIVELTWRTALTGAFNRFNDILQIEAETHADAKAAAAE
jgi:AhpD family alkylhydroperoxidase